jgi:hypothetical protein
MRLPPGVSVTLLAMASRAPDTGASEPNRQPLFMRARNCRFALLSGLVLLPGHAFANVGVPPITNTVFGLVLWFIPIVFVETVILKKQISISTGSAAGSVTVANLVSTTAGFGFVFLEGIVEIPLLPYHVGVGTITDLITLGLFVPFFFFSVVIELPVHRLFRQAVDAASLKRAIILANIGSYLLMSTFLLGRIIKSAIAYGTFIVDFRF